MKLDIAIHATVDVPDEVDPALLKFNPVFDSIVNLMQSDGEQPAWIIETPLNDVECTVTQGSD